MRCVTMLIIASLTISPLLKAQGVTYYVNDLTGNDSNPGTDANAPWRSLTPVNATVFQPGDQVLFMSGGVWMGPLSPKGSGASGAPVRIGKYGGAVLPHIMGNGDIENVVVLRNQEYWTITNLEITNTVTVPDTVLRRGVYIEGMDAGILHAIILDSLYIHDISGDITLKEASGIYANILGSSVPTAFDSLIVQNCRLIDIDRTGFSNASTWETRTLTTNTNWFPSTNVIFRNNLVERSGGNGLIVRVAAAPLIERNIFRTCGIKTTGNAMFPFNCDDALFQYNEACWTVYNPGDADASGFDADYRCKRTVIQYNYSHDNEGGFLVVTCQGGTGRFNDGTIVRYNISQNDGWKSGEIIHLSGQTTNTTIHNNVIYASAATAYRRTIDHVSWSAYPDRTYYYNNIFYLERPGNYYFSSSTNNVFDHNVFYALAGNQTSEPVDSHKLTTDPKFVGPGTAGDGIDNVSGYMLLPDSPCIDTGFRLVNHAPKDYWGNPVPDAGHSVDRGAYEFQHAMGVEGAAGSAQPFGPRTSAYPNPFNPDVTIRFDLSWEQSVTVRLFDILGREVRTVLSEVRPWGMSSTTIDGSSMASGMYVYRVETEEFQESRRIILAR